MATHEEQTGVRDLTFSGWVRRNLPDSSTGFMVSDLDFILWNYRTRRLMLVEVKTHSAKMKFWQESLFGILNQVFTIASGMINPPIYYRGFHCIRFENTCFDDGRCLFDTTLVSEQGLITILSMEDEEVDH